MSGMFYGASAFNQDLSSWDVMAVTDNEIMWIEAPAMTDEAHKPCTATGVGADGTTTWRICAAFPDRAAMKEDMGGSARADGHCGDATILSTAAPVHDLSLFVDVVKLVAGEWSKAKEAAPFLAAINDAFTEDVTAFVPVDAAFEALGDATYDLAELLMFHAIRGSMEEGEGYDALAGAAAGQLTFNGDEVEGPCNSAKLVQTIEVCESVLHVVDAVLLPAKFCGSPSPAQASAGPLPPRP